MTLPIAKQKKLINKKEIEKIAKKVNKSFEEEVKYLMEKKNVYGNSIQSEFTCLS